MVTGAGALDGGRSRYAQEMRFRALPDFDEMILPNYKRIVEARHNGQRPGGATSGMASGG
jgi:hypothetical protein